jgi:hypothetical protein
LGEQGVECGGADRALGVGVWHLGVGAWVRGCRTGGAVTSTFRPQTASFKGYVAAAESGHSAGASFWDAQYSADEVVITS